MHLAKQATNSHVSAGNQSCDWVCEFEKPIYVEDIPLKNVLCEVDSLNKLDLA
jgi:hypothetical protein